VFDRMTEQEKRHKHPAAPDYSTASSELYSSTEGLACFALVDTSSILKQRRASGLSFFLNPEYFIWVPNNPSEPTTAEQYSPATHQRLFESHPGYVHVFARRTSGEDWFDIGKGLVCGYSGSGATAAETCIREINVRLVTKLSEPLWLEFGGHPGWYLAINNVESEAFSPDAVMEAIRDAWNRPPVDVEIGRYAGDGLFAIADEAGRATVNHWSSDNKEFVSGTPQLSGLTVPTHIFLRSNSYDHEVAMGQVITPDEALSIIERFVMTGKPAGLTPWSVLFQEGERADVSDPQANPDLEG
jgi:hypothetical protein